MARDLKTYEQLKAYLAGKLGSDEQESFEQFLHSTEGQEWLRVRGAIEEAGDQYYRDQFLTLHEEMKPKSARRTWLVWASLAVAAAALLLFLLKGSFFSISTKNPDILYAQNFAPSSSIDRNLVQVPRSPQEIIDSLSMHPSPSALENRSLGIAYMKTEQFEKAIDVLGNISYESFLKDEAVWLQALAALKSQNLEAAKTFLEELLNSPENENSSIRPKAQTLLQDIQELSQ